MRPLPRSQSFTASHKPIHHRANESMVGWGERANGGYEAGLFGGAPGRAGNSGGWRGREGLPRDWGRDWLRALAGRGACPLPDRSSRRLGRALRAARDGVPGAGGAAALAVARDEWLVASAASSPGTSGWSRVARAACAGLVTPSLPAFPIAGLCFAPAAGRACPGRAGAQREGFRAARLPSVVRIAASD
jgi:hypothetical protein